MNLQLVYITMMF
ncbi:UNVERIFIED_CONTAM: hypothetical protein GTU68_050827 [Idotea baltica]|nr:hypothetical protein [Idotea baltica]